MDILEAREQRSIHITKLMTEFEFKTIAILKLNVVGKDKNPKFMKFICLLFDKFMKREFKDKIILSRKNGSFDGDYIYYVIDEEGSIVKERTIIIEDKNPLGRLVDIDIYHKKSISRQDLSCEMRKCLVCDNFAHICSRSQTHSKEEINEKVKELIEEHLTDLIHSRVMKSIHTELDMYPKFGLVSNRDSGVHDDMNIEHFIKSTFAIKKYIKQFILYGIRNEDDPLKLQKIGEKAEKAMFKATNNINTQKGLIFALGVFLPAFSKAIVNNEDVGFVQNEISAITKVITKDYYKELENKENLTHGDIIYQQHKIRGIRGEALKGFDIIFEINRYENISKYNRPYEYFIELMSKLDDTTIIYRNDLPTLRQVQKEMTELISQGGFTENTLRYKQLSDQYISQGISPGGSSDLLVLKLIYERLNYLICTTCIK